MYSIKLERYIAELNSNVYLMSIWDDERIPQRFKCIEVIITNHN